MMKLLLPVLTLILATEAHAQRDVHPSGRKAPVPQAAGQPAIPPASQEDYFEQIRALTGRVEEVENQLNQINAADSGNKEAASKERQAFDQKFVAYEDALKKIEVQVLALMDDIAKLKAADAAKEAAKTEKADKKASKKNPKATYDEAEQLFKQNKFKEAILIYQKYRDANPKGKFYPDATYKMGVCFQEVGLKDEAKVFFEEVVNKFPGSKEAKKAAFRSKQLK